MLNIIKSPIGGSCVVAKSFFDRKADSFSPIATVGLRVRVAQIALAVSRHVVLMGLLLL